MTVVKGGAFYLKKVRTGVEGQTASSESLAMQIGRKAILEDTNIHFLN